MVRFWDASALIPLWIQQSSRPMVGPIMDEDPQLVVWWGTVVECTSAIARLSREGLDSQAIEQASAVLQAMASNWVEVEPTEQLRTTAEQLLWVHALRAADAFQLAAALRWSGGQPVGAGFVCLDERLREAARREGFTVLPQP